MSGTSALDILRHSGRPLGPAVELVSNDFGTVTRTTVGVAATNSNPYPVKIQRYIITLKPRAEEDMHDVELAAGLRQLLKVADEDERVDRCMKMGVVNIDGVFKDDKPPHQNFISALGEGSGIFSHVPDDNPDVFMICGAGNHAASLERKFSVHDHVYAEGLHSDRITRAISSFSSHRQDQIQQWRM